MEKNPFSIHDFLGYVLPGGVALLLAYMVYKNPHCNYMTSQEFIDAIKKTITALKLKHVSSIQLSVATIIVSYIAGHLVAYLSSITVERVAIWQYNYPSVFLLSDKPQPRFLSDIKDQWQNEKRFEASGNLVLRLAVSFLLLLPLTVCVLMVKVFRLRQYFIKSLDKFLQSSIRLKFDVLARELGISEIERSKDSDSHRIIYHYMYENFPGHRTKMDNYVALYGVLRSLTLISNIFIMYIWKCQACYLCNNFTYDVLCNYPYLKMMFIVLIQFLFFMAFMKFYRRFTLESFMCMASMKLEGERSENSTSRMNTTSRVNTSSFRLTFLELFKKVSAKKGE